MQIYLTLRDKENWFKSVSSHIGELRNPMHEWLYEKGKGVPKYNKEKVITTCQNHLSEVLKYFKTRPDDLLIMDLKKGDGWEKLCAFLNKPIPKIPFPHANKAKARVKRTMYLKAKQKQKIFLQINYINMRGLIK